MEKQLAAHSSQKTIQEMNSRKDQKHKFHLEEPKSKIPRPSSAVAERKGEYIKNTISHDFKKGALPTTNKSKKLMVEH